MTDSVYSAIGGHDAVVAVVDGLYTRLVGDPKVAHHFSADRLDSLKAGQVRWFTAVLQGQDPPSDLAEAHAHLQISDEQVEAVIGHLNELLVELGVDRRLRRAVDAVVSRLWFARQF